MFVKVLASLLALSHVVTVALITLWFGLSKPKNRKEFWSRFKAEFLHFTPQTTDESAPARHRG